MSSPMELDLAGAKPTRAEHGRQVWDDVVTAMVTEMDDEHGETITPEQVEDYLRDELDLADPYDETEVFDFEDDDELVAYLVELESVTLDDVHFYLFGGDGSSSSETEESTEESTEEASVETDDEDGGVVLVYSDDEEMGETAIDPYYSSEDDEEPKDDKEFAYVLSVARAANTGLTAYLRQLSNVNDFLARIRDMIRKIIAHREKHGSKVFPNPFYPVALTTPVDWPAFTRAMSIAKRSSTVVRLAPTKPVKATGPRPPRPRGMKPVARAWHTTPVTPTPVLISKGRKRSGEPKPQKPTVYEFDFAIWDNPTYRQVAFRGRQLKTPSGAAGRTWPEIALDLDRLANELGELAASSAANDKVIGHVGNRVLATAMLLILAGRGKEVRAALAAAGFNRFAAAESVILEFLTLAYGIETIRLPYAQLDTVLHLANIAAGARFRGPKSNRRYTFVNVYSSARDFPGGPEHVYVEGIYQRDKNGKKLKELTRYEGFTRAPLIQSLAKKTRKQSDKSGKSVGKSIYSHSA